MAQERRGRAGRAFATREGVYRIVPGDMHVLSGPAAWIASTLCRLYVLLVAPLSTAYGLTSLTYVFITLAGVFLFGEPVRPLHGVGTVLIVIGIASLVHGE